jgi:hypothetical protein
MRRVGRLVGDGAGCSEFVDATGKFTSGANVWVLIFPRCDGVGAMVSNDGDQDRLHDRVHG